MICCPNHESFVAFCCISFLISYFLTLQGMTGKHTATMAQTPWFLAFSDPESSKESGLGYVLAAKLVESG